MCVRARVCVCVCVCVCAAAADVATEPLGYYYDANSKYYWNPETQEWYYQDASGNFVQAPSGALGAQNTDDAREKEPEEAVSEAAAEVAKGHR